jgi:threonine/homoserine/homoserine lactone efflux protein
MYVNNMGLIFFIKGLVIGFAMAVPIGPIGILCIRKTLAEGRSRGMVIGIGAATADMLYSSIAAFGLTFVSNTLFNQRVWMKLVGGALLLFLGIKTFRAQPRDPQLHFKAGGVLGSYLSTVLLTLTNPLTIFAFIAVFATFGLNKDLGVFSASALVGGVFTGSFLWFLTLSTGVKFFRKRLNVPRLQWVNKIAGILIIISGALAAMSVLKK